MSALAVLPAIASALLSVSAGIGVHGMLERLRRKRVRRIVWGPNVSVRRRARLCPGLEYAARLSSLPFGDLVLHKTLPPISVGSERRFRENIRRTGYSDRVTFAGYREARIRLTFGAAAAGLLFGLVFSTDLGVVLGALSGAGGSRLIYGEMVRKRRQRQREAESHLSEMLEVVSLGMRSGLTFDLSFALYTEHFESSFARDCRAAHRRWISGLATRSDALVDLADYYDSDQLARTIESINRSLSLGTELSARLADIAAVAREKRKAELEEEVSKAPVKMMIPTGTLILPAMLLLVMGPVLLELAHDVRF